MNRILKGFLALSLISSSVFAMEDGRPTTLAHSRGSTGSISSTSICSSPIEEPVPMLGSKSYVPSSGHSQVWFTNETDEDIVLVDHAKGRADNATAIIHPQNDADPLNKYAFSYYMPCGERAAELLGHLQKQFRIENVGIEWMVHKSRGNTIKVVFQKSTASSDSDVDTGEYSDALAPLPEPTEPWSPQPPTSPGMRKYSWSPGNRRDADGFSPGNRGGRGGRRRGSSRPQSRMGWSPASTDMDDCGTPIEVCS